MLGLGDKAGSIMFGQTPELDGEVAKEKKMCLSTRPAVLAAPS